MNRIFIFILFLLITQACEFKREAIGGNDDIIVLAAKEDREKINSPLSKVFDETILTPSPENFYKIKFTEPGSFSALKTQTNLVLVSIGDYELNPGTKLVKDLLGNRTFNKTLTETPVIISKNQFANNQVFMIISGSNIEQIKNYLLQNKNFIKKQFDENFFSKQSQFFLENERQVDLEKKLEDSYSWTMKIPWGWELIRDDSNESFFWIGQELPFRWIAVHWRDGNFLNNKEVSEYIKKFPENYFKSISYNKDYLNIESNDFQSNTSYKVFGLWESIEDAKGGPFNGYIFYDKQSNRTFYISYIVFNPGGKKAFYMKQMEMIIKTIKTSL